QSLVVGVEHDRAVAVAVAVSVVVSTIPTVPAPACRRAHGIVIVAADPARLAGLASRVHGLLSGGIERANRAALRPHAVYVHTKRGHLHAEQFLSVHTANTRQRQPHPILVGTHRHGWARIPTQHSTAQHSTSQAAEGDLTYRVCYQQFALLGG